MSAGRRGLINTLYEALFTEPYLFIVNRGDDEAIQAVEEALSGEDLKRLVRREDLGDLAVYYLDIDKLARLCSYESCSNARNRVEFEACIQRCIDAKIDEIRKNVKEAHGSAASRSPPTTSQTA